MECCLSVDIGLMGNVLYTQAFSLINVPHSFIFLFRKNDKF